MSAGSPYLPNLLGRYFDSSEFDVSRDCDDKTRLILLPCASGYRLSRKLAAIKGKNIFTYDALPEADRSALRQGHKKLVLDMGGEMFFARPDMIDGMHEGLAEIGLSRSHMAIVNGDATAEANYFDYCRSRNIADPISIITSNANPLFFLANQRMTPDAFRVYTAGVEQKRREYGEKKVFLNFNGRSRPHRIYTVLQLMAHGLMDCGFVSLLDYSYTTSGTAVQRRDPDQVLQAAAQLRSDFRGWPSADMGLAQAEALLAKLPLELDLAAEDSIVNNRHGEQTPWEMQNLDLYHRSYLSLVTDTLLPKDNQLFVTEKPVKCFVGFHPFIYIGFNRALDRLRSLGFQTFHPFINESYDLEHDGPTRLMRAVDELRRLASLPKADLQEIYASLWPRLLHNARHACVDASAWGKAKLELDIRQRLLAFGNEL
jgi:hypothetical protein